MYIRIDLAAAKPVYLQIIDQIKFAVASGRLRPGDRLPAIRDLAVQLRVNRNTVAKVYSELERDGLLYTRVGQGAFVSDRGSNLSRQEQRKRLTALLDDALAQAALFGLSREETESLIEARLDRIFSEDDSSPPPPDASGGSVSRALISRKASSDSEIPPPESRS